MRQCLRGFGAVHHFTDADSGFDIDTRMIAPLHLIRIKQPLRRAPSQKRNQFPGKVGGIPNARAHSLSQKRRHQMCRVSGDQQAPGAPSRRQFGFKTVDRAALNDAVFRRDGRSKFWPYEVVLRDHLGGLFRLEADFPAPPIARTPYIGCRARTVAGLDRVITKIGSRLRELDINHQPPFLKAEILPVAVHGGTNHRARAIRPDHIMRRQAVLLPVLREADPDQTAFVNDFGHFGRPLDGHIGSRRDAAVELRLEVGLVKPVTRMPAKRPDLLRPGPVQHQLHIAVDEFCPDVHTRIAANGVGKADRLENPHRFVVKMNRPRKRINAGLAFQNNDVKAVFTKDIGKCGAGRTEPHDHDIMIRSAGRVFFRHRIFSFSADHKARDSRQASAFACLRPPPANAYRASHDAGPREDVRGRAPRS